MTQNRIRKQVHLGAHFPGVNNTTVWTDPASKSQIEFSSFEHLARSAERGLFDFFFLAEGLRLREHQGKIHDLDVVGRPDTFSILNAVAGVTTHLAWPGRSTPRSTNLTSWPSSSRRSIISPTAAPPGTWSPPRTHSPARTSAAVGIWSIPSGMHAQTSWSTQYGRCGTVGASIVRSSTVSAVFFCHRPTGRPVPTLRQAVRHHRALRSSSESTRHPVLLQAGDSDEGREFGAAKADAIFTGHGTLEAGKAFYADVKGRLAKYGRTHADLKILPAATFVLGDNAADAQEKAYHIRRQQVGPQTAIAFLEQVWGRDLSQYDADGPLPKEDPSDDVNITRGRVRHVKDPRAVADQWRAKPRPKTSASVNSSSK